MTKEEYQAKIRKIEWGKDPDISDLSNEWIDIFQKNKKCKCFTEYFEASLKKLRKKHYKKEVKSKIVEKIIKVIVTEFLKQLFDDLLYNNYEYSFPQDKVKLRMSYRKNFQSNWYKANKFSLDGKFYQLFVFMDLHFRKVTCKNQIFFFKYLINKKKEMNKLLKKGHIWE